MVCDPTLLSFVCCSSCFMHAFLLFDYFMQVHKQGNGLMYSSRLYNIS